MAQLSEQDKSLIKEAHLYVYTLRFKKEAFHPVDNFAYFTLPQLLQAYREGFDYYEPWSDGPVRLNMKEMQVLQIYRVGLSNFVNPGQIPELALLLDFPSPDSIGF